MWDCRHNALNSTQTKLPAPQAAISADTHPILNKTAAALVVFSSDLMVLLSAPRKQTNIYVKKL